jgi:hypothetical protein
LVPKKSKIDLVLGNGQISENKEWLKTKF